MASELVKVFVAMTEGEASKVDSKKMLSAETFEFNPRSWNFFMAPTPEDSLERAFNMTTEASINAASEQTDWFVLELTFSPAKMLALVTSERAQWNRKMKSWQLLGELPLSVTDGWSWVQVSMAPRGPGQLLRPVGLESLDAVDCDGRSAVHRAVLFKHHPQLIVALLEHRVMDVTNLQDNHGSSPLQLAAARCNVAAVRALCGNHLYQAADMFSAIGPSAVHIASMKTNVEVLQAALEHPSPDLAAARDKNGNTPLHWAAGSGNVPAMLVLLRDPRFSGLISVQNSAGKTAGDIIVDKGFMNCETFQTLVSPMYAVP
jgi:hypothetical protein